MEEISRLVDMTATIVAAYVSNHRIATSDLQSLILSIYSALQGAHGTDPSRGTQAVAATPAVAIKKSVTEEHLICLEDGKKFKSLKRHLSAHHGMSPAEYREKWGLPSEYPMVAPAYTQTRSKLALASGLGRKRRKPAARRDSKSAG